MRNTSLGGGLFAAAVSGASPPRRATGSPPAFRFSPALTAPRDSLSASIAEAPPSGLTSDVKMASITASTRFGGHAPTLLASGSLDANEPSSRGRCVNAPGPAGGGGAAIFGMFPAPGGALGSCGISFAAAASFAGGRCGWRRRFRRRLRGLRRRRRRRSFLAFPHVLRARGVGSCLGTAAPCRAKCCECASVVGRRPMNVCLDIRAATTAAAECGPPRLAGASCRLRSAARIASAATRAIVRR